MQHWQKALPPYYLVLGQLHGLAAYMQRPQHALHYHPVLNTQRKITMRSLFLNFSFRTFAIAASLLRTLLTVRATRSRNYALYAILHSRARHVGHQFSHRNFFYYLCVCFLSQQIERAARTSAVNLSELAAGHSTFCVNVTHKKNLKKALLQLRSA